MNQRMGTTNSPNRLPKFRLLRNSLQAPSPNIENSINIGKNIILEIEVQGAMQIKEKFPDSKLIFIMPPNIEELKNRLNGKIGKVAFECIFYDSNVHLIADKLIILKVGCSTLVQNNEEIFKQMVQEVIDELTS